jgi:CRP-like cAMP-binding protein
MALYTAHFEKLGLTRREFHGLLRAGAEWRSWTPDEAGVEALELTREDQPVTELMLITAGTVEVLRRGAVVSTLGAGALVGEGTFACAAPSDAKRRQATPTTLPLAELAGRCAG